MVVAPTLCLHDRVRRRFRAWPLAMLAAVPAFANPLPYEPDPHTLHLWHLDEPRAPFADAGVNPSPLAGLLNGALPGQPSIPAFGRSISFHQSIAGTPGESSLAGAILLLRPELAQGDADNAPSGFRFQGADGAFTFEAVVRFSVLPGEALPIASSILSMEGEGRDRIFNFRVEREGFLAFTPLADSGASGGALATIPSGGPHAINTRDWFHVAVRYDGRAGVPGNLDLFWTNLSRAGARAHRIGGGMLDQDLAPTVGDFAIGNEARSFEPGNAEAEPFPGWIDEVRISSVARHPSDFLFVPIGERLAPETAAGAPDDGPEDPAFGLTLAGIAVDGGNRPLPPPGSVLSLPPGLHRIDFDIGLSGSGPSHPVRLRSQLEGFDERWIESSQGMSLVFQFLDGQSRPISQAQFDVIGSSAGWGSQVADSSFNERSEPVFVPANAAFLRVNLSSGSPDTTGSLAIDDLEFRLPGSGAGTLWKNGSFDEGMDRMSPTRAPAGWERGGSEPAIARIALRGNSACLVLVDGDQGASGEWTATQPIEPPQVGGRIVAAVWREAHNVIGGDQRRATYLNVPSGRYTFRAIGLTGAEQPAAASLSMPLEVRPHLWQRSWFWPLLTAGAMAGVATLVVRHLRRRNRRRLRELSFQHALERDRTRIARDLHDDLGTRVTVLNLTASLARQSMDHDPDRARRQLDKMTGAARELVVAMDDLVWTVDPTHDNLDDLASQLTRHAEEIFRDSPVRCRLDIPSELPPRPINSDLRHNVSMAVREALHNILKHAGPCEATLRVRFEQSLLTVEVVDTGRGFDADSEHRDGHGLHNFQDRLGDLGGTCQITSSPGGGTRVSLRCPVPEDAGTTKL